MQENIGSNHEHTHVHELLGSVKPADYVCMAHNHRIATVTGHPVELDGGGHAHGVSLITDSFEGHCHVYDGMTGCSISICGGHVHYMQGMVSQSGEHRHCFMFVTHIADPISE